MNIKITKEAINAIKNEYNNKIESNFIRISVIGGGCNGVNYKISLDEKKEKTDIEIKNNEIRFIIDIFTYFFIKKSIISYKTNYNFVSSFIFNTPFSKKKCSGCG